MRDMYKPMATVRTGPAYTMAEGTGWMAMVGVSLPISGVEQKRGELRFVLQTGGRRRHYIGRWDGTRLSGKISGDATGSGELGTFELTPR